MSTTPPTSADAAETPSPAQAAILHDIRAGRQPAPSLFWAFFRERQQEHLNRLRSRDAALEQVRYEALYAAARLMGVDEAERVFFSSYQGVSDGDAGKVD